MKVYTDISQSKKLAKILPLESADYCWGIDDETLHYNSSPYPCAWKDYTCKEYYIPCWSLAALLGVLPNASILLKGFDKIYNLTNSSGEIARADNPVDACYEIIIKLNELKRL